MRRLIAVVTALAALAVAGAALAVLPKGGSHYKGTTSAPAIGKFKDPVSFGVNAAGNTVTGFKFGFISCFGSGGPPPTKNPYALKSATVKANAMLVASASSKFSGTAHGSSQGTTTTATVTGKFKKTKGKVVASGRLSVTQNVQGQGHCGPSKLTFSAKAK